MTNYFSLINRTIIGALLIAIVPAFAWAAFNSGSTGADGVFNPTVDTELQLPPSGIFHFTTVNIPAGVTVKFKKNALNMPVTLLASGDVTIAGTIDISGSSSQNVGTSDLADYTFPGLGGPGGFDGGRGGMREIKNRAGNGQGPGAGAGGNLGGCCNSLAQGGGGAGYKAAGANNIMASQFGNPAGNTGLGGPPYGSPLLIPLLGGSGGGGGAGGTTYQGSGGGGGGGAVLIAASGTVNVTGSVLAKGGAAGNAVSADSSTTGACGGGGSGGGIRIVASNIGGNGSLSASGGATCSGSGFFMQGGSGGVGRVSTEVATTGTITTVGFPTLRISSVAGIAAPAAPTGNGDIVLPADALNPVTVVLETTGVPITNTVKLTLTPVRGGPAVSVTSPTLTGTTASATTSVNIDLPMGPSTLFATTTFTIVVSLGDELSRFAKGERVEKIELAANANGQSMTTLITVSGKRYSVPSHLVPIGG